MEQASVPRARQWFKTLVNDFLIGTLTVLPAVIVIWIVTFLADLILSAVFGIREYVGNTAVTLAAFAGAFGLLTYIGHTVHRRGSLFLVMIDHVIDRIPFLNTVYRVSQGLIDLFRGHRDSGREVVYVEYPRAGMWLPAYLTNREGEYCVLFIPTSPNPTNGFTVIVHQSQVVRSGLDLAEATRFIISLGVEFPKAREVSGLPR
ncbi:DUF502 domain-containing protein [Candidatus Methylocalor cossyra]|uniref:Membrane protein n=1 Tax=Candidatus Methylocalor cossyra TaxID=3108543 RepID=A0ABM9NL34_9GAMM